ncbi:MAG TPA: MFS transporter [Xanthobacteraceae bacterium]|jgi:MFS family permease|nr:MFS transporter [Xanthobacteraceae bacterium]
MSAWRTPIFIIGSGCLIAMISFGPRSTLGFFLTPLSNDNHWGRDVFSFALALQNLLWGIGQPLSGIIADRFGTIPVLCAGAILYALGLGVMSHAGSAPALDLSATLIGFGLAGCSFTVVLSALGKLIPPRHRTIAFGFATGAGSFGQFLYSPVAVALMDQVGWQETLIIFAFSMLAILPLSFSLSTPRSQPGVAGSQSLTQALREAFAHRSYVLLVLGFFTCGFQLQFITVHLPPYLVDRGLSAQVGSWTIATIGLCNIVGSVTAGWLGDRMPKRYVLSFIYFTRAAAIFVFISVPMTTTTCITFGAVMGLTWLSTVPPTNGIIAVMFGTRWLSTLTGFAFFSHQVGGFLGVWLGGIVFERTGSYDAVWWLSILFGLLSGVINLPIVEEPVARAMPAPA